MKARRIFLLISLSGLMLLAEGEPSGAKEIGIYFRPSPDKTKAILGYEGIKLALEENGYEGQAGYISRLDEQSLKNLKVLIIPCVYGFHEPEEQLRSRLRSWVENGLGLMLINEAVGWRRVWSNQPPFPEIGQGKGKGDTYLDSFAQGVGPMTIRYVFLQVADHSHPLASGIQREIKVLFDMPELGSGEKGQVVLRKKEDQAAALVAGNFGKGRVILLAPNISLGPRNLEQIPEGEALKLLLNCVKWLSQR
ncbi:MAG: hypothetical protein NC911_03870 [Candidatus Omnitrophica bacterium]|nr:hypothetical protein [Candidatus Omnitrophota bacterium]MCM8768805.1 hypothetical protein [Candidatus Omnitrophota bacterium]